MPTFLAVGILPLGRLGASRRTLGLERKLDARTLVTPGRDRGAPPPATVLVPAGRLATGRVVVERLILDGREVLVGRERCDEIGLVAGLALGFERIVTLFVEGLEELAFILDIELFHFR